MEQGVNVPLELWGTTSPGGRESTGAQVRGAASPEKASAYLASVEPQGHILVWVLSSGSKAPSSGWGGSAGGEVGSMGGSAALLPLVALSPLSWLHCSSPAPGSPFKWNVPFALGARGEWGGSPWSRTAFFSRDWRVWDPIRHCCRWQVDGGGESHSRGQRRTRQTYTRAPAPEPGAGSSWRLAGNRHRSLPLLAQPPLGVGWAP